MNTVTNNLLAECERLRRELADALRQRDTAQAGLQQYRENRRTLAGEVASLRNELTAQAQLIARDTATIHNLCESVKEALTMAENLRRATDDAIPGGICHTLRAALAGGGR